MIVFDVPCPRYPECPYGSQCVFRHPIPKTKREETKKPLVIDKIVRRPKNQQLDSNTNSNNSINVDSITIRPSFNEDEKTIKKLKLEPPKILEQIIYPKKCVSNAENKFYGKKNDSKTAIVPIVKSLETKKIESIRGTSSKKFTQSSNFKRDIGNSNNENGEPKRPLPLQAHHARLSLKPRISVLSVLYKEFIRIYASMPIDLKFYMAQQDTLKQEFEIAERSRDDKTYKSEAAGILSTLKKRKEVKSGDENIGTLNEIEKKSNNKLGKPLVSWEEMIKFVHPISILEKHGYVTSIPSIIPDLPDNMESQNVFCDRCGCGFIVYNDPIKRKKCFWHPERLIKLMDRRSRVYSCCHEPESSKGCEIGVHVFKQDSPEQLHRLIPFIISKFGSSYPSSSSSSLSQLSSSSGQHDILALDCEMSYTTLGTEMTRLSVLDAYGNVVLDKLVKPYGAVLDLNTRWSGVTSLDNIPLSQTLNLVRSELLALMNEKTILIGHGFENDLRALRLIHNKVVDTAILIPNPTGSTYKPALRRLSATCLGKFIQQDAGILPQGHDSTEDSRICLELLNWYVGKQMSKPT